MNSKLCSHPLLLMGACLALCAWIGSPVRAQSPKNDIQYQARLLDLNGQPVNTPLLQVTFNVYGFAAGGPALYTEQDALLNITDGLVSTPISIPASLLGTSGDLYIGVTYGADTEMAPRLPLRSVPYAFSAPQGGALGVGVPAGTILMTGSSTAPTGYLICDGSAVSRAAYANLFASIGTAYGAGDGSTTFNLPDLRQRFALGRASSGTGSTLGSAGGSIDHTHTSAAHAHDLAAHTHEMSSHSHTMSHLHFVGAHSHDAQGPGATISIASNASSEHVHNIGAKANGNIGQSNRLLEAGALGTSESINAGTGSPPLAGEHSHDHASFGGRVGNVNAGLDGDAGFNTGAASTATTGATGGMQTGPASVNQSGSTTPAPTGSANPPFQVVNYMVKT